jgi:predicted HTH transcriptional regulator
MRFSRTLLLTVLAFGLLAGACSSKDDPLAAFCETHTDPALQGLDPSNADQADELSGAMAKMEENAPAEIKDDVRITREGFEAAQSGDITSIDVEAFQEAAANVEAYAEEHCT